jgi:hypothetical protein
VVDLTRSGGRRAARARGSLRGVLRAPSACGDRSPNAGVGQPDARPGAGSPDREFPHPVHEGELAGEIAPPGAAPLDAGAAGLSRVS